MIQNKEVKIIDTINVKTLYPGEVSYLRVNLTSNGLAEDIQIPVIAICGRKPGPTVGITAAVHGNELNGLPVIYGLVKQIDPYKLKGNIIAVPVVNTPAFLAHSRYFTDGADLNRLFPGKRDGNVSEQYVYHFIERVVKSFDYLIDLHTASFGRVNSLYVRADLTTPVTAKMAYLQRPQIVVHNCGGDNTLRSAAVDLNIPAITVEVGNPLLFQKRLIRSSIIGLRNVLSHLKMVPKPEKETSSPPIICNKSYWIYTDRGGILESIPDIVTTVEQGDVIGVLRDIYGQVIKEYKAPEKGIIIGKSTNPIAQSGSRILHLGVIGEVQQNEKLES